MDHCILTYKDQDDRENTKDVSINVASYFWAIYVPMNVFVKIPIEL